MKKFLSTVDYKEEGKRLLLIVIASVLMAINIKSFVRAGGLFPSGFNGITLLIQRSAEQFLNVALPFSIINFVLNAIPATICFFKIGKKFTIYSALSIVLTSILTDLLPSMPITYDVLLICIFGGLINGFAIGLCLKGRATSGGTDFIAIFLSERMNIDAWNYILIGNAGVLVIAGLLFGWDKALCAIKKPPYSLSQRIRKKFSTRLRLHTMARPCSAVRAFTRISLGISFIPSLLRTRLKKLYRRRARLTPKPLLMS